MKFGHDLLQLEAGAPDALRGQFIQYKQLKKLLKQLPAAEDRTEAEQEFFRRLRAEVQAVNQCAAPSRARSFSERIPPEQEF
jgi:SPX domain protein involved in polyphosphate accumulation